MQCVNHAQLSKMLLSISRSLISSFTSLKELPVLLATSPGHRPRDAHRYTYLTHIMSSTGEALFFPSLTTTRCGKESLLLITMSQYLPAFLPPTVDRLPGPAMTRRVTAVLEPDLEAQPPFYNNSRPSTTAPTVANRNGCTLRAIYRRASTTILAAVCSWLLSWLHPPLRCSHHGTSPHQGSNAVSAFGML